MAAVAALLTVMAVALTAHPPQSYADDPGQERFTVQLKYYDDVQINYTVRYPNGGIWTGAGDVPIGGDTSGAVSQLYCVDPFVHFHSIATTSWPGPDHITTDTMADYSVGAPWSISSSLRNQRDAVSWLVTNGYRGDYLANDAQSRASVERLRALYPGIVSGLDDHSVRRIGLMATKVAIWKVLEEDNVVVSRTSLPVAQSPLLNSLVTAMMADARANRTAAGLTVAATKMEARVLEDVGGATTITHTPTPGDKVYYGPLQVEVEVDNALNNDPGALDKVFLSALGTKLSTAGGNVRFVTFNNGQVAIHFDTPTVLPYGNMYGTGSSAQYLSGSFDSGGAGGGAGASTVWRSPIFYLEAPDDRGTTAAASADDLTIHSVVRSNGSSLVEGTPITLVWADPGTGNQSWGYVQAYSGAANDGIKADLYANASLPLGHTALGSIQVGKQVRNTTPDDGLREYSFQLYYSDNLATPFISWDLVELDCSKVISAVAVNEGIDTFTLRNGGRATLRDLPEGYYRIAEINDPSLNLVSVETQVGDVGGTLGAATPAVLDSYNILWVSDAVHLAPLSPADYDLQSKAMLFTNTREQPALRLYISKAAFLLGQRAHIFDRGQPYRFLLERSVDGITWTPVDLSTAGFGGTDAMLTNAAGGEFSLVTTGECYIDLPVNLPGSMLRVTELDADASFAPAFELFEYDLDDPDTILRSDAGFDLPGSSRYSTYAFAATDNHGYDISFANVLAVESNLRLSKSVTGSGANYADRDALYPFRLFAVMGGGGGGSGGSGGQYVAFTTDPSQLASGVFLVSGITADRLSAYNGEAEPTIIWLKSGETAVIEKLPANDYRLEEWVSPTIDTNRYRSSYIVVNDANSTVLDAADGRIAAVSLDIDNLGGDFTNDFPSEVPRPFTGLPATSDNSTMLIALFISLLAMAAALFALHRRSRRMTRNGTAPDIAKDK